MGKERLSWRSSREITLVKSDRRKKWSRRGD